MIFNRKKYTGTTNGHIIKNKPGTMEIASVVWVEYCVNGLTYTIRETVKLKSSAIKAGPVPIGQIKTPRLPNIQVGTEVCVCFRPDKPDKAYIKENVGRINV